MWLIPIISSSAINVYHTSPGVFIACDISSNVPIEAPGNILGITLRAGENHMA